MALPQTAILTLPQSLGNLSTNRRKSKSNKLEIHIHHPAPKPPVNVTRVIRHSTKGDKKIVYRSLMKERSRRQKKVVHHHLIGELAIP